jgi:hypothetical protein
MNKFGSLFGAAILALASMPASAGLIPYYSHEAWSTAASSYGGIEKETFDVPTDNKNTITILESGIVSSITNSGASSFLNVVGPYSSFNAKAYYGQLGTEEEQSETITWDFPKPLFGFFGDFASAANLTATFETVEDEPSFAISQGGFGVLLERPTDQSLPNPFSQVTWGIHPDEKSQLFRIDNFDYVGTDSVSPVPAPAALWLFGIGLLGLIGFNRRSKAA